MRVSSGVYSISGGPSRSSRCLRHKCEQFLPPVDVFLVVLAGVAGLEFEFRHVRRNDHRVWDRWLSVFDQRAFHSLHGALLDTAAIKSLTVPYSIRHSSLTPTSESGAFASWADYSDSQSSTSDQREGSPSMKAAFIESTGAPGRDPLWRPARPRAEGRRSPGENRAVAVNPIDTYIRAGIVPMPLPMPFVIGCDLAGVVDKLGAGTTRFKVGDRVWGSNQGLLGRQGTFAEYASVAEECLYPTPPDVKDEDVAAIALVGITAHLGLFLCASCRRANSPLSMAARAASARWLCRWRRPSARRLHHRWLR